MAGQGTLEVAPGMTIDYERSFIDQLADMDIIPADIDYLALSHMHFDHANGPAT